MDNNEVDEIKLTDDELIQLTLAIDVALKEEVAASLYDAHQRANKLIKIRDKLFDMSQQLRRNN